MFAESLLAVALSLVAAPPKGSGPPTITLEEMNAFVEAGNYHRIRVEKLGHRFRATGTVETLSAHDRSPLVAFPGHLYAALRGLPKDHDFAVGDRIRFEGLIVDEGYACLQIWTYRVEKLQPKETAKEPAKEQEATAAAEAPADLPEIRFCEPASSASATPPPPASLHDLAQRNASKARSSEDLLPKLTPADLDAAVKAGDYTRVRSEFVGLRLDADAVVEKVGAWPFVRLSENWHAHLHSHSDDFGLKEGDRIRIVGLICDEAYGAVTVWVERVEKLPAK